jgi:hypothetical protein
MTEQEKEWAYAFMWVLVGERPQLDITNKEALCSFLTNRCLIPCREVDKTSQMICIDQAWMRRQGLRSPFP